MKRFYLFLFIFLHVTIYAKELTNVTLQLSWLNQFQFAGYIIAKEKGFYKDVGLDVYIREFSEANIYKPYDFRVTKSSVLIDAAIKNDVVALGVIFQKSPMMLMSLASSNINSPKDLVGKNVMMTIEARAMADIIGMISSQNIKLVDVNFKQHSYNLNDLIEKKCDAMACFLTNEPFLLDQKGIKYNILHPKDYGFDFYEDFLITTTSFLDKNPKLTKDFYEASLKGWRYAIENIDESARIIYEKYNTQGKSLYSLIQEGEVTKELVLDSEGNIGVIDKVKLAEMLSVFKTIGLINSDFDFSKFIYEYNEPPLFRFYFTPEELNIFISFSVLIFLFIVAIIFYNYRLKVEKLQKQIAQQEVDIHKEYSQNILNSMGNVVLLINNETDDIVMVNEEFYKLFEVDTIKNFNQKYGSFGDLFIKRDGFIKKDYDGISWIKHIEKNSTKANKILLECPDAKQRIFFVSIKSINNDEKISICVLTDITDLQAWENKVFRDMKLEALDYLMLNLAHQWRQPLSIISTAASSIIFEIENELDTKKNTIDYSKAILNTTKSLSSTLDTFMMDSKKQKVFDYILFDEIFKQIDLLFESSFKNLNIEFIKNIDMGDSSKLSVPEYVFVLISSLIQNSIDQFMVCSVENKLIFLDIKLEKNTFIIDIYDNGGGASDDVLSKLFEPYLTTHHQSQGKGLGLFSIKQLITKYNGGKIHIDNKKFNYQNNIYKGFWVHIVLNVNNLIDTNQ